MNPWSYCSGADGRQGAFDRIRTSRTITVLITHRTSAAGTAGAEGGAHGETFGESAEVQSVDSVVPRKTYITGNACEDACEGCT